VDVEMKLSEIEEVFVIVEVVLVEVVVVVLEEVQEVVVLVDQYCLVAKNYDRRRMELFPIKENFIFVNEFSD
jgi:hypothetical protein